MPTIEEIHQVVLQAQRDRERRELQMLRLRLATWGSATSAGDVMASPEIMPCQDCAKATRERAGLKMVGKGFREHFEFTHFACPACGQQWTLEEEHGQQPLFLKGRHHWLGLP